ncbi:UNVERIFIED_CONTAM: hypothetical protein FKN15_065628 [Acipenser sinensis]
MSKFHPCKSCGGMLAAGLLGKCGGVGALGQVQFPPVVSTIAALVQASPVDGLSKEPVCNNGQCRIMEAQFKKAYAAEVQVMRLANTAGTLLQISGFQGQALGRSLEGLLVARRQLWLSQARVPDADKSTLLDMPISPGHTFGPAVEEILQCSHQEREVSQQMAVMLPSGAPLRERMRCWRPPVTQTVSRTVPIHTAPCGDLSPIPGAARKDGGTPTVGPRRISVPGCSSNRTALGSLQDRLHPSLSSTRRGPEGLQPQTHPVSQHQLQYWCKCTMAVMLPSSAPLRERMRCWRPPVTQTVSRTVPIHTAPCGDLSPIPGAARKDGGTPTVGPRRISVPGCSSNRTALGSLQDRLHPSLSSTRRGPEGLQPQTEGAL